jgi:hypothetical protein
MNLQEHIRKVLKEETENLSPQDKLKQIILKDGWKRVSELLFGFENLYLKVFNNDYKEFLNLYNNLEVVQNKQHPQIRVYSLENGNGVLIEDTKKGEVTVSQKIWTFFREGLGLQYEEIQEIIETWLEDVYNLTGVTVTI